MRRAQALLFNPKSASFTNVVATLNGVTINADELAIAATLKTSKPELRGAGFSREHIVIMMKVLGWTSTNHNQTEADPSSSQEAQQPTKNLHDKLKEERDDNNKLVKRLYFKKFKGEMEFSHINNKLNAAVGIRTLQKCFDEEILQRRYQLAKRWLLQGIEPEVPYHDESIS